MFNQSLVSVFGLMFGEQLQNMGQGTFGAALVMNLNSVALNFSGKLKLLVLNLTRNKKKKYF